MALPQDPQGAVATLADTGRSCPYCRFPIKQGAQVAICSVCRAPHHVECWEENHGCATVACTGGPATTTAGAPSGQPVSAPMQGHGPRLPTESSSHIRRGWLVGAVLTAALATAGGVAAFVIATQEPARVAITLAPETVTQVETQTVSGQATGPPTESARQATGELLPERPSSEPAQLAAEINRAEEIVRDTSATASDLQAAGRLQQLAFRRLAKRPELQTPTLRALSPEARSSANAAIRAADAVTAIVEPQRDLPDWRIVGPPPPRVLLGYFQEAQASYGVKWQYLASIQLLETRMGRIRGASPAGAQGPMQFIPATWGRYGKGDINDQRDSIMAAARLLIANGAPGDMDRALYRYNPSSAYVVAIESYADQMIANERAFYAYYYWQVLYKHVSGTLILPVGYPSMRPQRVED